MTQKMTEQMAKGGKVAKALKKYLITDILSINIERDDSKGIKANENTLFYIYPATYDTIASHNYWAGAPKQLEDLSEKLMQKLHQIKI